jgi:hypothetical protein
MITKRVLMIQLCKSERLASTVQINMNANTLQSMPCTAHSDILPHDGPAEPYSGPRTCPSSMAKRSWSLALQNKQPCVWNDGDIQKPCVRGGQKIIIIINAWNITLRSNINILYQWLSIKNYLRWNSNVWFKWDQSSLQNLCYFHLVFRGLCYRLRR